MLMKANSISIRFKSKHGLLENPQNKTRTTNIDLISMIQQTRNRKYYQLILRVEQKQQHNETSDRNFSFHAIRCEFFFLVCLFVCYQHVGRVEPVLCMRFILYLPMCNVFIEYLLNDCRMLMLMLMWIWILCFFPQVFNA